MSLHSFIPDSELPLALKCPLVFGDRNQINALYDLQDRINLIESEQAELAGGNLKYFNVCITYSGEQTIKILAIDQADAKEKAREEADMGDADIEIDYISVSEIKK